MIVQHEKWWSFGVSLQSGEHRATSGPCYQVEHSKQLRANDFVATIRHISWTSLVLDQVASGVADAHVQDCQSENPANPNKAPLESLKMCIVGKTGNKWWGVEDLPTWGAPPFLWYQAHKIYLSEKVPCAGSCAHILQGFSYLGSLTPYQTT